MSATTWPRLPARRTASHPLVPAVGVALLVLVVVADTPVLVAWVVLALAAGYAISGSA